MQHCITLHCGRTSAFLDSQELIARAPDLVAGSMSARSRRIWGAQQRKSSWAAPNAVSSNEAQPESTPFLSALPVLPSPLGMYAGPLSIQTWWSAWRGCPQPTSACVPNLPLQAASVQIRAQVPRGEESRDHRQPCCSPPQVLQNVTVLDLYSIVIPQNNTNPIKCTSRRGPLFVEALDNAQLPSPPDSESADTV